MTLGANPGATVYGRVDEWCWWWQVDGTLHSPLHSSSWSVEEVCLLSNVFFLPVSGVDSTTVVVLIAAVLKGFVLGGFSLQVYLNAALTCHIK